LVVEGLAGVRDGELPVNFHRLGLALPTPAIDLVGQLGPGRNAALQTLATQGRKIRFNLVKSGAALGRVVPPEPLGQALGHGHGQAVVKSAQRVGVEVVRHEPDFFGPGVAPRQLRQELGVLALGAPASDLVKALAGERLNGGQYAATAVLGVGVALFGGLARLRGQALDHVAEQKAGALVETDDAKARVVGAGIEGEQRFEAQQALPVDLANAPLAF